MPANINLKDKNVSNTASAKLSATFHFSKEDLVPDLVLSEVIWKAVKGEYAVMPAQRRSAFLKITAEEKNEKEVRKPAKKRK